MEEKINTKKLIKLAKEAQKNSYAPYSKFNVGACVLCKSGKTYLGANVENASYPAGICAERSAMLGAICAGEKEFEAIAITSSGTTYAYPCGICRQFLSEFNKDIKIIVAKTETDFVETTLSALLPNMFDNSNLN